MKPPAALQRRRFEVRGIVQGVGFRPFVYRLAEELGLTGWVCNDAAGVSVEVDGPAEALDAFARRLRDDAPALARVHALRLAASSDIATPRAGFAILPSRAGPSATAIGPDSALCDDCRREMLDPADRRWRYAFINCTHCGPRFTITRALPYDRANTSMARFRQCAACQAEYDAPSHRRFHAEPNACPDCGPQLRLLDALGRAVDGVDPLAGALQRIAAGGVVAIKGLGGFHVVCDARQAEAVAALRQRKSREEKPFAVMVANLASLHGLASPDEAESRLLSSAERPIVLLRKAPDADRCLPGVAPGLAWLGAMLPYTPLQVLLFHEAAGRPTDAAALDRPQPLVLVMTSANPGGEPLVTGNDEAVERLAGIADAFLVHDRDIVQRCDDSVLRVTRHPEATQFVRRARGYTPRSIRLASAGRPVLALGAYFKNTACVIRGDEAFVSQHIGDLDNVPTCLALDDAVQHLLAILQVRPEVVAHDLHPDFYGTRLAARLAETFGAELLAVQHHHAHIAAVLAEHRLGGPVLGLALDGVGLGTDGQAWGGELLRVDRAGFTRLGHLRTLRLPGGDRAAREPWRVAVSALVQAGAEAAARRHFGDEPGYGTVHSMLVRDLNAPPTSSLGRWFDAAAGVLGVRRRMAFEGQAAMLLEGLAEAHGAVAAEPAAVRLGDDGRLDLEPLIVQLADEPDPARGAARFHATLVWALAEWASRAAAAEALNIVACAGGCLLNAVVAHGLRRELAQRGLTMLEAQAVPPNDGGIALGQAWVAGAPR